MSVDFEALIQEKLAAEQRRAKHVFTVPPSLHSYGIQTMTFVALRADEEILATKRAGTDIVRVGFELAKESLRAVNDKPVSTSNGTADTAWNEMDPKVRNLALLAYQSIHTASDVAASDFLKSAQVQIG